MMHKYAPDEEASILHVQSLDSILGEILDDDPGREIYLTADHGMSAKTRGIDIEEVLLSQGVHARAIPIIKDRYVVHHQNLGGASYVYLDKQELIQEAIGILQEVSGIEAVYPRAEAAEKFALMESRIGDLFVLGDKDTVFGEFATTQVPVQVRSHGSRHESAVPILAYGSQMEGIYQRNFHIAAHLYSQKHGEPIV
jgi:phosphonoacetate hydrolase